MTIPSILLSGKRTAGNIFAGYALEIGRLICLSDIYSAQKDDIYCDDLHFLNEDDYKAIVFCHIIFLDRLLTCDIIDATL